MEQEKKAQKAYRRWLLRAPLGLALVGFGACLIVDAGFYRYDGAKTLDWVAYGTLALVVFNSGLSVFGDAILQRIRYERWNENAN